MAAHTATTIAIHEAMFIYIKVHKLIVCVNKTT